MIEHTECGATVITGEHMDLYRLIVLKSALELQKKIPGMKISRGVSASAVAKRNFGMKGNIDKLIQQTQDLIDAFRAAEQEGAK